MCFLQCAYGSLLPALLCAARYVARLLSLCLLAQAATGGQVADLDLPSDPGEDERFRTPTESVSRSSYGAILRRVNELQSEGGWRTLPVGKAPSFQLNDDTYYRVKVATLGGAGDSPVEMCFLGEPCRPIRVLNDLALPSKAAKRVLYDGPTSPSWSKEQAVSKASAFLAALLDSERRKSLKLKIVQYEHPYMEYPRYYRGEWFVGWVRTDGDGHEFNIDCAIVVLVESEGLLLFRLTYFSKYNRVPGKVLEAGMAGAMAKPYAAKILRSRVGREWCAGMELRGEQSGSLKIVNPNHILEMKSLGEIGDLGDMEAKLAWVISFPTRPGPLLQPGDSAAEGEIRVWLDAHTGEFLGGGFK